MTEGSEHSQCCKKKKKKSQRITVIAVPVSALITWKWCCQPRLNSANSRSCARALGVQKERHMYEQSRRMESVVWRCNEIPPKLEILLADKLSTVRCRRDDRAAKLVTLFPARSSLSRFIHSPMQPRSCIPERGAINYSAQNNGMSVNSYRGLAISGTVSTPSQIPQFAIWAARRLSCHSRRLKGTVK